MRVLAGLGIAVVALAAKAALNQFAQGDTGYILLMAAAVLAAWFAGLIGGMTAIVASVILNGVFFLGGDATLASRGELVRQIIYVRGGHRNGADRRLPSRGARPARRRPGRGCGTRRGGRGPRPSTRGHARGFRDRILGVGHHRQLPDMVGRDLPPARPGADAAGPVVRGLPGHDPSRRSGAVPHRRPGGGRGRGALRPRFPGGLAGRIGPLDAGCGPRPSRRERDARSR